MRTLSDRFWENVVMVESCWHWTGKLNWRGYGVMSAGGKNRMAHRVGYELLRGPIPAGLTLDHLCRRRDCVNPEHLEPVTLKENILRGNGFAGIKSRQTHCKYGHPLSGDNLYLPRKGGRECKECRRIICHRRRPKP